MRISLSILTTSTGTRGAPATDVGGLRVKGKNMAKYEEMVGAILSRARDAGAQGYYLKPFLLGRQFQIETRHVRETLLTLASNKLVSLEVCCPGGFRPFTDWKDPDEFFECGNTVGEIKVKLLAKGDGYLEQLRELKHRPIGFRPKTD